MQMSKKKIKKNPFASLCNWSCRALFFHIILSNLLNGASLTGFRFDSTKLGSMGLLDYVSSSTYRTLSSSILEASIPSLKIFF